MSKIKFIKNHKENFIKKGQSIEGPVFNNKLYLNINLNFENLNNFNINSSFSSEDSDENEEINSSTFLSKELIEELNSSNLDNSFKDYYSMNSINEYNSYIYLINNYNSLFNNFNNNINNNGFINKECNLPIFSHYNNYYNNYYNKKYYKKKYKNIKDKKKDWICQICLNLNYAFRTECNRCKLLRRNAYFNSS